MNYIVRISLRKNLDNYILSIKFFSTFIYKVIIKSFKNTGFITANSEFIVCK